jgi:hypothetical protein
MPRSQAPPPSRRPSETSSPTPDGFKKKVIGLLDRMLGRVIQLDLISAVCDAIKRLSGTGVYLYSDSRALEQRRHAVQAIALEMHNAEFSPIYTLPPEVCNHVLHYVSTADIMSLRLVSRRFVWSTQRQESTWGDKRDFQARLHFDRYTKLAKSEPTDIRTLNELVCSYCYKPHPRCAFDRKEATRSPYVRQCHGSSRKFRLCAHTSKDRRSIMDGGSVFGLDRGCRIRFWFNGESNSSDMIYGAEDWLGFSHMNRAILRDEIRLGLQQIAIPVCPHMRTDEASFLNRVLTNPRGHLYNNFNNGRPIDDFFADSYELSGIRIACLNQRCGTMIEIERRKGLNQMWPIQVRLRRNLGRMEDVLDPKWVIQLEVPDS